MQSLDRLHLRQHRQQSPDGNMRQFDDIFVRDKVQELEFLPKVIGN